MFPVVSPSGSPNFQPSDSSGVIDLDDFHNMDLPYNQQQSLPALPAVPANQETPSSPIPPLSLGEPFIKGIGHDLRLRCRG